MKKICIQLVILVLLLFSSIGLSAQLLISEQFDTGIPVSVKRYFDSSNYMQICENSSQKVFVKNRSVNQDFQKRERENIVTLSINLDFDPLEFYLSWGYIMIFNELGYSGDAFYEGFNQINIQVPEGNYDIMTEFVSLISGASHIVIKEQEAVMGDTEISLNPNDADNYIAIIALDENGEMLQPGIENPNNGAPSMLLFDRAIRFNSTGLMNTTSYFWSFPYMGSIPWNFYINDVSDRYSIIHSLIGFNYEMGDYITKYETLSGISDNISISNNPEDYISHIAKFQPSKIGLDEVYAGFLTIGVFNGDINSFFGTWELSYPDDPMDLNEGIKLFLNNTLDNNPAQVMVLPTITELTTEGGDDFFIKGSPICLDEYGYVLYGSGDISFGLEEGLILGGENYYLTENFQYEVLPFHHRFSFPSEVGVTPKLGNNVPIVISAVVNIPGEMNVFKYQNKGRYGENRETDFFATQIEVKQNGNVVFSGDYSDIMYYSFPTDGDLEIKLVNANSNIEGMEGMNITSITYNANIADAPPTLQHLQFRDANEKVTDRFSSASEGTVRISAGDFQFTLVNEWGDGYYDYNPGNTVEIYYSLYGQDTWTEIELTEYPEYFQMPAFGDYYEASLGNVVVPKENSWFDVKVICTDSAGNKQEQIISPAFKIEEATGIETVNQLSVSVYPNPFDEAFHVQLPEGFQGNIIVTDLLGRTIHSEKNINKSIFTWNSTTLSTGVYILSVMDNSGRSATRKIVKR